jgi:2-dehydropantoate 2-reductase
VAFLRAGITSTAKTTSSLYRDMAQGRPVEADAILGDFVATADRTGVATPLLSAAYANLAIYAAGLEG